jgi:hypothetical protein
VCAGRLPARGCRLLSFTVRAHGRGCGKALDAMRTGFAFLVSAVAVAALVPILTGRPLAEYSLDLFFTMPVVGFFTVIIAVPVYLLLPQRYQTHLMPLVAAGFAAAAISWALLEFFFIRPSDEIIRAADLPKHGWDALASWWLPLEHTMLMGVAGAAGAGVFWATRWRGGDYR